MSETSVPGEGGRPQDETVSRRWFLNRMAWVSSAAASGSLLTATPAFASAPGRPLSAGAFDADVRAAAVDDLTELTIYEAATLMRRGEIKAEDLLDAHLERIAKVEGVIQAYANKANRASLMKQLARTPAASPAAPLRGIPLAPKDNFYTTDLLTEGGSLVYQGFQPTYDATAVALLRNAGGLIIGKATMGNLAGGSAAIYGTDTPTTRNAWSPNDPAYGPSGSSSGSGAAVAARMAMGALGTQTGGSVMGPGTAEGLTCIKPTFGRVSLHGVIPLSYTRDHVGEMARTAMDAAILLQVLAQPDPRDPRTLGLPKPPDYMVAATPVGGSKPRLRWPTRVGVWPGYLVVTPPRGGGGRGGADGRPGPQNDPLAEIELRKAMLAELERLGADIVTEIKLPDQWEELNTEPLAGSHGDPTAFFIPELRKDVRNFASRLPRFLNGMLQSADTYVKVQQARALTAHRMMTQLFNQCDVIVGAGTGSFDSVGFPLLCMPIGTTLEARIGRQVPRGAVMGAAPFGEERLLSVAAAYQAATQFHTMRPADPQPTE